MEYVLVHIMFTGGSSAWQVFLSPPILARLLDQWRQRISEQKGEPLFELQYRHRPQEDEDECRRLVWLDQILAVDAPQTRPSGVRPDILDGAAIGVQAKSCRA